MKIAIIGAGVSGLVAAHLLARAATTSPCSRRTPTRAATRTRCASTPRTRRTRSTPASSSSTTATTRSFERLLDAARRRARSRRDMSFGVTDEARRLRVRERARRTACSPSARTSSTPWFHRMVADLVRFSRDARAAARRATTPGPSLGDWLERAALLARVRRAADRAAGRGRLVGRPAPDVDASRRASWSSSSTTTGCSASATARAGARSRAARSATSRRSSRRGASACGSRRRCTAIARHDDHVEVTPRGGEPERFDHVVLATHSDQALRAARRRDRPRARAARRDPVPAQRGGAAHRHAPAAAPPPRVGELELPPARRPAGDRSTVTYHMNRLQSLRRRPRVLRHAQPHATRSTRST